MAPIEKFFLDIQSLLVKQRFCESNVIVELTNKITVFLGTIASSADAQQLIRIKALLAELTQIMQNNDYIGLEDLVLYKLKELA